MSSMDYKTLAAEREARLRSRGIDPAAGGGKTAPNPWAGQRLPPAAVPRTSTIYDAHRSIRMAHRQALLITLCDSARLECTSTVCM